MLKLIKIDFLFSKKTFKYNKNILRIAVKSPLRLMIFSKKLIKITFINAFF